MFPSIRVLHVVLDDVKLHCCEQEGVVEARKASEVGHVHGWGPGDMWNAVSSECRRLKGAAKCFGTMGSEN